MKSYFFFAGLYILLLLLAIGCDRTTATTEPATVPPLNGGVEAQVIDITLSEFYDDMNMSKDIELVKPGSLIVRLESNPSTGYEWAEAEINDVTIIAQVERNFVEPNTKTVGAAGTDVWTFDSLKAGTTTIKFYYGRPWDTLKKGENTLTLYITVK